MTKEALTGYSSSTNFSVAEGRMKFKKFRSIPIFLVFLLMDFAYYITVFVFIEAWIGLQSSAGFLNALVFTFVAALCLLSFFVCVLTDPGRIPSSYVPDFEETTVNSDQGPNNIQLRHCDKCRTYKPPRAHHCRVCRRCVLKMDHHCQWINNCVGYWNYKAYFILVLHATIGSIYSTVVFSISALQKDWNSIVMVSYKSFYVVCGVIMISLSLTFGSLLGWHIYLITQNMTTVEYYEARRADWLARKSGQSYRHPYNLSAYKNIISVFGRNMLQWLCPTATSHLKDGLSFPTSTDSS